jgi:hypothetical protein
VKSPTPTCLEIECLLARRFDVRSDIIVPNVSHGASVHECDLLVVNKSGYATEFEIKVSKSDLKKDAKKAHKHVSKLIKYLYFAIPEKLEGCIDMIPQHAGIILIKYHKDLISEGFYMHEIRHAEATWAQKWTDSDMNNLNRLGTMRIFGLKQKIVELTKENQRLKNGTKQNS